MSLLKWLAGQPTEDDSLPEAANDNDNEGFSDSENIPAFFDRDDLNVNFVQHFLNNLK